MVRMRVLFITHCNGLDGANRSLLQLVRELRDNHGVEPVVVCPRDRFSHVMVEAFARENIVCMPVPLMRFKLVGNKSWITKIMLAVSFLIHDLYLIYALKSVKFDLVHSNSSVIDMGAYLARWRGVPHVWHLREFGYEDFRMISVFGQRYERWIYKRCVAAIAISKVIEHKFKPLFGTRMRLIYNGIVPKDESLSALHKNPVTTFCIAGRLEPNKNQMEVLKACRLLKQEIEHKFKLLVIGGGGNVAYTEELKQYAVDNGLTGNVSFMGYRADVPEVLSHCDVGLTASVSEAFGRITVEYMMQNLAVIASDTGANPEIVCDGETGLLYHSGDAKQLADKMRMLIDDRDLLLRLAAKGKQHALKCFSSVQNSDSIFNLYKTLVKE